MMEWQPIPEWEGIYEVSNLGHVRRVGKRLMSQWPSDQGYQTVRLSRFERRHVVKVHRLVAMAFIPNPSRLPVVNHIDSNRSNNAASNLEWCTQLHNLRHAGLLGRMQRDYWKGKRSPNAVLSDNDVRLARELYATGEWSWERIGNRFCISKRAAGRCVTRESYSDVV